MPAKIRKMPKLRIVPLVLVALVRDGPVQDGALTLVYMIPAWWARGLRHTAGADKRGAEEGTACVPSRVHHHAGDHRTYPKPLDATSSSCRVKHDSALLPHINQL